MIIYFLELNKIYTFKLPLTVSGNYILSDYDSNGNKRSLVSVSASNGKWIMRDNDEVKIYYNQMYNTEMELSLYTFYQLVVYGTESVLMYVAPVYDPSFTCRSVVPNSVITFGNSECDINFPVLSSKQLEIHYTNGNFSLKNLQSSIPVYVNNIRKEETTLKNFDIIFVMGLRIVILGSNIYVNNPNQLVIAMSSKFSNPVYNLAVQDVVANADFYKDFYEEKDYFFKTPVFQNALEKLEMTIAPPPEKYRNQKDPLFLTIIPSIIMEASSLLMGYYAFLNISKGGGTFQDNFMTIMMCVGMLVSGLVWPFIERFYEKFVEVKNERKKVKKYTKYLKKKEEIFKKAINLQKATLIGRYLSLEECRDAIYKRNPNLFSRNYDGEYFLSIRLGVGNVPLYSEISYEAPEYSEESDKLRDNVDKLIEQYKYLPETPYYLSLYEKNILAFIGPDHLKMHYLDAVVLQLIAYHSYTELKIVLLSDSAISSTFNYLKNSNFCWNNERSFRLFANSYEDGLMVSDYLEREFALRTQNNNDSGSSKDKKKLPYYLILSDNITIYRNLKIIDDVLEQKDNIGFGLIMFDSKVTNIPDGCENFVNYTEHEGYYFRSEMTANNISKFVPEFVGVNYHNINMEQSISLLSNIPLRVEVSDSGSLPDNLGFLEMYGVGNIEQLNILNRWQTSNIVNSLMTPIGVDTNGNLLNLDLHEKKHGPHGLIAGTTGSGKSECIVTYLLSLAVNYSPYEVQFILIDYKGGGLAGAYENRKTGVKLPHLVGTITNLDKSEMNRTLVSIKSELQRRQKIFNEAKEKLNTGTIDIYKYQRLVRDGKLALPLAHLFIVCDEFAELKAQQPDFMDELVSAARIGRSLGVHLILATQKPSGVVDEQIWSNSKFKICCKVQTVEDSNEMIQKPDAAYIKEAGRFYLLVGNDEYFVKGQSAYTGTSYVPSDKINSKFSTDVDFVNHLGEIVKSVSKDDQKDTNKVSLGEELINISSYIVELANKTNFKYQQLWLDNVPKILYLDDACKKYNVEVKPFDINPLIGEYDDPENQAQGYVSLPITLAGNTYIVGGNGMGKNTLMSAILYSSAINHRPEEVNFYIIDLGSEKLRKFSRLPHVGDVLGINDKNKISYLLYMLLQEMDNRKNYYSQNSGDFLSDVKSGKSIFPNIIVMIYDMEVFRDSFEEMYDELFVSLTRNCSKYGIYFIVSGATSSSLGYSCENNFPQRLVLNLVDSSDYSSFFSDFHIPSRNPGRGLVNIDGKCLEFQSVIIFNEDEEHEKLSYAISILAKAFPNRAKPVPDVPKRLAFNYLSEYLGDLNRVPLGVNLLTAQIGLFDFSNKITLLSGDNSLNLSKFLSFLVRILSSYNNNNLIILNGDSNFKLQIPEQIKYYDSNFTKVVPILMNNINKYNTISSSKTFMIIVLGYSKINFHLSKFKEKNESVYLLDDLIQSVANSSFKFLIYDSSDPLRRLTNTTLSEFVDNQNGIWVGKELDMQDCFSYDNISSGDIKTGNDTVVLIKDSIPEYLKFPTL